MTRATRLGIVLVLVASLLPASLGTSGAQAIQVHQAPSCAPAVLAQSGTSFGPLVRAQNGFGFRLLRALIGKVPSDNTFISPTSVSVALAMAYDGARGTTARAMAGGLGLQGISQENVRKQAAALLGRLQTSASGAGLSVANSLWARQGIAFRQAFLQHARSSYGAQARVLNFDAPGAPATINQWVSCATQGKIPSIISGIRPEEVMFLINAVYFHGDWAQAFEPSATRNRAFTTAAGKSVQVPLMSRIGTFGYYRGSRFQAVRLPYVNPRFSMVVVLPDAGASLSAFAPQVTAANWNRWMAGMRQEPGSLALPRFSLRNSFQLNGALGNLGMGSAFSHGADFSGMCVQHCFLTEVKHKTYLAVNEKGTVAAAVTSVGVGITAMPTLKFQMVVDHPFFLAIQDSTTHAILFTGLVTNPAG